MRMLLTSEGLTNATISSAFVNLLGKDPERTDIVVVPTATLIFREDHRWMVDYVYDLAHRFPWQSFELCDVAAFSPAEVTKRLSGADVVYALGGSEYYLAAKLRDAGFPDLFGELDDTLWVGASAGSMVLGQTVPVAASAAIYAEATPAEYLDAEFFGLLDFGIIPHYGSTNFPGTSKESIAENLSSATHPYYAIDDDTAISVIDGRVEVLGTGDWRLFHDGRGIAP